MTDLRRLLVPTRHDASVERWNHDRDDRGCRHEPISWESGFENPKSADYNQRPMDYAMF